MTVAPLSPALHKQAAKSVAAAFYDYPSLQYYFPDPKRRTRRLPWYMGRVLNCARLFGEVLTTEDASGVLFALPPGRTRLTDADYVRGGLLAAPLVVGLGHYKRVSACEACLADTQERLLAGRPHYYLWGLAVAPEAQRTGAGTALLAAFLMKTDAEGLPVYLETHRETNVPYYESRGFRLIGTETVPGHRQAFWCLLREPG